MLVREGLDMTRAEKIIEAMSKLGGPKWESQLTFLQGLLEDEFPSGAAYRSSVWAKWVERIEKSEQQESRYLKEEHERISSSRQIDNCPFDPGDWLAEASWLSGELSENMYAALVVSVWSTAEGLFKKTVAECQHALQISGKVPYRFDEIRTVFKKQLSIELKDLPDYKTVDAIRNLNNCYKHTAGYYKPKKLHEKIDQGLIQKWHFLDQDEIEEGRRIHYDGLPIEEMVAACHTFFNALFDAVLFELRNRKGQTPNAP
jgi:hypothetical protein